MNNLEKMLFLEMTNIQFRESPNSVYYSSYKALSQKEKEQFTELYRELHNIWNYINSKPVLNVIDNRGIDSVADYNEKVAKVDRMILQVSRDFELAMKNEMNEELKNAIISFFGIDFYNQRFAKK